MNVNDAFMLAQEAAGESYRIVEKSVREHEYGFYVHTSFNTTERMIGVPRTGVLVNRRTCEATHIRLPGRRNLVDTDYLFEAAWKGLHQLVDLVVVDVLDKDGAAEALVTLGMGYVVSEVEFDRTWTTSKRYTSTDFLKSFENLPVRFEAKLFLLKLREIEAIEQNSALSIRIDPCTKYDVENPFLVQSHKSNDA